MFYKLLVKSCTMLLLVMTFRKLLERVLKLAIIIIREAKYLIIMGQLVVIILRKFVNLFKNVRSLRKCEVKPSEFVWMSYSVICVCVFCLGS